MVVVGSGAMAQNLSRDIGVQLLINALSTIFALGLLIKIFGEISGAHFNPAVTLVAFLKKRIDASTGLAYVISQFIGGFVGTILGNLMFGFDPIVLSTHNRSDWNLGLGEIIATSVLILVIEFLVRTKNGAWGPVLVPAWIGSAYFFTSSTSFANPAVTLARAFTDTFSGIELSSVPFFIAMQVIGAVIGMATGAIFNDKKQEIRK